MKTNAIAIDSTFVSIVLGVETSLGSVEIANIVAFADTAQAQSPSTAPQCSTSCSGGPRTCTSWSWCPHDVGEEARVAIEGRGPPRPSGATPTPAARITMARKCHVDADFIYINGLGFYF